MIYLSDIGLFVLRLAVGLIFLYHSLPKLKNPKMMAQAINWPAGAVLALGLVEFLSSLGQILGIYPQIAAVFLSMVMIGAITMKIIKWKIHFTAYDKTGWEFDFVLLAANITILLTGGGTMRIL